MFGHDIPDLITLEALTTRQEKFDPSNPLHTRLLDIGMIVKVGSQYHAMPTTGHYEALEFESARANLCSFGTVEAVGDVQVPGVQVCIEFGVDISTGREVPVAAIPVNNAEEDAAMDALEARGAYTDRMTEQFTTEQIAAGEVVVTDENAAEVIETLLVTIDTLGDAISSANETTAGCKFDTDGDGNCHVHPTGCPAPESVEEVPVVAQDVIEEVVETPAAVEVAPEPVSEKEQVISDKDEDGIPTIDDTRQWERTIGDLPQAFEALRPAIRMLVTAKLNDLLFTKVYSAAFQAKEVARTRDFINAFNKELPTKLNEQESTLNAWFEPWLNELTKRVLTFDGSDEVQSATRFILKQVPDDRKKEIADYLTEQYVNKGISRFFPEAVRRYKEVSGRATIGFPVTWILKTAESMDEQAQKEVKRPPTVDPALIEHALDLMPTSIDRPYIRERLMHHLAIGNGIFMDEILTAWETGFGNKTMPALRYSAIHNWLKDRGKLYLSSKEAITMTAKEIIWNMLGFIQPRVEEPIGSQTWQESNAAQDRWIKAAWETLEEHTVEGVEIYEPIRQKFYDEMWTKGRKEALTETV